jgi:hypothetical protein
MNNEFKCAFVPIFLFALTTVLKQAVFPDDGNPAITICQPFKIRQILMFFAIKFELHVNHGICASV